MRPYSEATSLTDEIQSAVNKGMKRYNELNLKLKTPHKQRVTSNILITSYSSSDKIMLRMSNGVKITCELVNYTMSFSLRE